VVTWHHVVQALLSNHFAAKLNLVEIASEFIQLQVIFFIRSYKHSQELYSFQFSVWRSWRLYRLPSFSGFSYTGVIQLSVFRSYTGCLHSQCMISSEIWPEKTSPWWPVYNLGQFTQFTSVYRLWTVGRRETSCRFTSVLPKNAENLITNAHSRVFTQSSVFLYEVKTVQAPGNLITNAHSRVLEVAATRAAAKK
jgi:hypothetical protein